MQKTSRHATFSLSLPYEINNKKKGERHEYNHIGINTKRTDSGNLGHQECKGVGVCKTLVHAKKEMESVSTMVAEDEEPYMTKSEIMDGLSEACKDIKLMREGKLKGRPIEELLNEL